MSNKLQLFLLWALVIGLCVFAVRTDFAAFNLNKRVDALEKRLPVYTTNAVETFRNASTP